MANASKKEDESKPLRPAQSQDRQPGLQSPMNPAPRSEPPTPRGRGRLEGRGAFITGGDSGIGRAVAVAFAREGADVAIGYLDEGEDARETRRLVEGEGRRAVLLPGDVSDRDVCEGLIQSAGEALGRLEGEGLVVKTHLIGYSAAPQISRRSFEELYELRLLLEPEGARHAAENMDEDRLHSLRQFAGAMAQPSDGDERMRYSAFARQDAAFHDRIMEFAENALIRSTLAHQHTHFHIFRLMFHARVTDEALEEHDAIMRAFSARDGHAADRAMRAHIERSRARLRPAFG